MYKRDVKPTCNYCKGSVPCFYSMLGERSWGLHLRAIFKDKGNRIIWQKTLFQLNIFVGLGIVTKGYKTGYSEIGTHTFNNIFLHVPHPTACPWSYSCPRQLKIICPHKCLCWMSEALIKLMSFHRFHQN